MVAKVTAQVPMRIVFPFTGGVTTLQIRDAFTSATFATLDVVALAWVFAPTTTLAVVSLATNDAAWTKIGLIRTAANAKGARNASCEILCSNFLRINIRIKAPILEF